MKRSSGGVSRRNFLLGAVGSAAAGASLVVKRGAEGEPRTKENDAAAQGYRVTEHVRNYYRTAKEV